MKFDTDLNFRVRYDFTASSTYQIVSVDMEEIKQRQLAGETFSLSNQLTKGTGPIKIDAEIKGAPYILSGIDAALVFSMSNSGDKVKGSLLDSEIKAGKLKIAFPKAMINGGDCTKITTPFKKATGCCQFQDGSCNGMSQSECEATNEAIYMSGAYSTYRAGQACINNKCIASSSSSGCQAEGDNCACTNTEPVSFYQGESVPLRFDITESSDITPAPFKKYPPIIATADYSYELRDSVAITVNPFKNV
jgi:hypothetical protein